MSYSAKKLESFYSNRNILVTGHTGFKGSWLTMFLKNFNAKVLGFSREKTVNYAISGFNNLICDEVIDDIVNINRYEKKITQFKPEIVFYLAAQPLVKEAFENPIETFQSNVMGLSNFFVFLKNLKETKYVLIITSDKVYDHNFKKSNFKENDRLGGIEPYGASKVMQEIISKCFYESYFKNDKKIYVARAGNVIGGGDFGKNRLVVDIVKAVTRSDQMLVRNPTFTRPWQYILDLIYGYMSLAMQMNDKGPNFNVFNFAPKKSYSVATILEFSKRFWKGEFKYKIDKRKKNFYEEAKLSINSEKIFKILNWETKYDLEHSLEETFKWYQAFIKKDNMVNFNQIMIEKFLRDL